MPRSGERSEPSATERPRAGSARFDGLELLASAVVVLGPEGRVIWLNPEARALWGQGDSEMRRYLPFCHIARECATLRQLERVMDDLLRGG